jgi:uncharacterized membrane protein
MNKSRLEAFTDAVIAIIMTILVLELKMPKNGSLEAIWDLRFQFMVYLISFLTLAIYWNNHHHMFQASCHVSGSVLWLNILIILFLSLFPFTTAWMSENVFERVPELMFAIIMLAADVIWLFLARALEKENGPESAIAKSLNKIGYKKSAISIILILIGIIAGYFIPMAALISCILSLIPWVIPDKDIETRLKEPR